MTWRPATGRPAGIARRVVTARRRKDIAAVPVTIDQMTAEVDALPERNTASEERDDKDRRVKLEMVRAAIAREAARAARLHAD
jgi:hypothetical protein